MQAAILSSGSEVAPIGRKGDRIDRILMVGGEGLQLAVLPQGDRTFCGTNG